MKRMDKSHIENKDSIDLAAVEQALLTLNYRLTSRALDLSQGNEPDFSLPALYDGLGDILNPATIIKVSKEEVQTMKRERIFHGLLGHYLQYRLFPFENELFTWMKGASASVDGEKIYFKDILSWCQKQSNLKKHRLIEKETSDLCKFLKPFALSCWEYLLQLLDEEFAYTGYSAYCKDKKKVDYKAYVTKIKDILTETETLYFKAMESWAQHTLWGYPCVN